MPPHDTQGPLPDTPGSYPCQRCPGEFSDGNQLRDHVQLKHPLPACRCSCEECTREPAKDFAGLMCSGPYHCACGGYSSSSKLRFNEHLRKSTRRQLQCSCGRMYREDKFERHLGACGGGSKPYVCWRRDKDHRVAFSTKEEILHHFASCERGKRGRPRKPGRA